MSLFSIQRELDIFHFRYLYEEKKGNLPEDSYRVKGIKGIVQSLKC
jgi:hypothetical protein